MQFASTTSDNTHVIHKPTRDSLSTRGGLSFGRVLVRDLHSMDLLAPVTPSKGTLPMA